MEIFSKISWFTENSLSSTHYKWMATKKLSNLLLFSIFCCGIFCTIHGDSSRTFIRGSRHRFLFSQWLNKKSVTRSARDNHADTACKWMNSKYSVQCGKILISVTYLRDNMLMLINDFWCPCRWNPPIQNPPSHFPPAKIYPNF